MNNFNNNKKNKPKVTAAISFLLLVTILLVAGLSIPLAAPMNLVQSAQAFITTGTDFVVEPKAPVVVSGDNIYIAWWTNNTANNNEEVMFRASTDGGTTFGDKINLSNTTEADSWRVEIDAEGDNVIVSWWEMNQTSDIPVARVSNDAGQTFGPMIMLGVNGTISTTATSNTTTTTATGGGAGGEQQQCQLEIITNEETFEVEEPVTITVTNGGDEALEFPNSMLGLEIENQDTGETYPLFSAQVITTLEPGESRTFEFTYEKLVSEIGTGTIEASVSSGDGCSASTAFTLAGGSELNSLAANSTNANSTNT